MDTPNNDPVDWRKTISKYTKPNPAKIWWQIANSFIPYFGLWVLMVYSLDYSYWITLGLSILAAAFLSHIFIILHDCGHGAYFKSPLLNRIIGIIAGGLVFTPYHKWHYQHMVHHQTTLGLIAMISIVSFLIGFKAYLLIQVPVLYFGSVFGVWLFYLQHQFKDVVWERTENWDYKLMAMKALNRYIFVYGMKRSIS